MLCSRLAPEGAVGEGASEWPRARLARPVAFRELTTTGARVVLDVADGVGHCGGVHVAVGSYCVAVAAFMALWWGVEIRKGALDRPDRSRAEIALHLAAELVTALLLAVGGIVLVRAGTPSLALVGLGMLLYTVVQSPGYFAARREVAPVVMFAVLAGLTIAAISAIVAVAAP